MPVRSPNESRLKAAVSVAEMARLCGLSRSHFNLLVKRGVMPQPLYSLSNRRPLYDRELQQMCLNVRETNTAQDGSYVVFYAPRNVNRPSIEAPVRRRGSGQQSNRASADHAELLDGLRALGMVETTSSQIEIALRACYPSGHDGTDEGEVLRTLFRHLRRTEAAR